MESKHVVVYEMFGDKSINQAIVKMQAKQDTLKVMRQGLLGIGIKFG